MKKVSFIKGLRYNEPEVELLPPDIFNDHFKNAEWGDEYDYVCTKSFTVEITVKIIPNDHN